MPGYTLEQLLEWTLEDRLIDGYSTDKDGLIRIRRGKSEHVLSRSDAEKMLIEIIRRINRSTPEA